MQILSKSLTNLFLLFFCVTVCSFTRHTPKKNIKPNSSIKWMTLDQALLANNKQPKQLFINIYAKWCEPCKGMEQTTYRNSKIVNFINDNYYPVKFDAETKHLINFNKENFHYNRNFGASGVHGLAMYFTDGQAIFPSMIVLDKELHPYSSVSGFQSSSELINFLSESFEQK